MIRLGSIPKEPYWLELLEGVRLKVRPVTKVEQGAARAYAQRKRGELSESQDNVEAVGADVEGMPELTDPDEAQAIADLLYAQGLGRHIILEWEGILDEAGDHAEVTPEAIDELMRLPFIGDLFIKKVEEQLFQIFSEGNESGPAQDGTSAAGPGTANDAGTPTPPAAAENEGKAGTAAPTSSTPPTPGKDGSAGS